MASFTCSKCRLPLSLAPELENPSQTTFDLLKSTVTTPRQKTEHKAYPVSRESVLHEALADSNATITGSPANTNRARFATPQKIRSGESYIVLPEATEDYSLSRPDSLSENLERQRRLFDVLSENSDIDHPLCSECTDLMIITMNKQMSDLERDRKVYISALQKLKAEQPSEEEAARVKNELEILQHQETVAMTDLETAEQEYADILAELAQAEKENAELDAEEQAFWHEKNKMLEEVAVYQMERDSINLRYEHDAKQLEILQKTNVYNDIFHIGHDGNFGTINGLRLGRLPNNPVGWDEINAAWGITIFLLDTMAAKLEYKFKDYELVPLGSTSMIKKVEIIEGQAPRVSTFDLFGSSETNPLKLFHRNSFDKAMVAFLDCLRQLGEHAQSRDSTCNIPYIIYKDKIGDACIRTSFNQDEGWTRALKFCLTNCKWILAVVAKGER